jgi:hypothetical protein
MPLQIRRGPTADRLSTVPLEGELVYDSTTGAVFIGNGTSPGGVPVTNISAEDVRNIAASQFLGISFNDNSLHTGITFQNVDNRIIATVNDSLSGNFIGNFFAEDSGLVIDGRTGTVYGPVIGSVFSEGSTLLVNGDNGSINLDGTVKGDITPDSSEEYDIGSPSNRFKDLYLSGSSLWLGDAQLTASGESLVLPSGTTVDGNPVGIELGQEYEINIKGDLRGSVYPDDSTVPTNPEDPEDSTRTQPLVDAINGSINLNRTVKGNIVPDITETHNIGSITNRFNKLYLTESNASLWIGNAVIGATGTAIDLPVGSTVGGIPVGSGTGDGVVEGSNYKINVVGNDSTVLVDSDNNRLVGTLVTSLIRSEDSSEITIENNTKFNSAIQVDDNAVVEGILTVRESIAVLSSITDQRMISVEQYHDEPTAGGIAFKRARGTLAAQEVVQADDRLGDIDWNAWSGTTNITSATIRATAEGTISGTAVPSRLEFLTSGADGNLRRAAFINSSSEFVTEYPVRQILTSFNSDPTYFISQHFDGADSRSFVFNRTRGTLTEPTTLVTNDVLGTIAFQGYDGSAFNVAASIRALAFTEGSGVRGGIQFLTNNGVNFAPRIVINTAGRLNAQFGIGVTGIITANTTNDDVTLDPAAAGLGTVNFVVPTQSTVGAAGAASALPASPSTYMRIKVGGVEYLIPAFAVS